MRLVKLVVLVAAMVVVAVTGAVYSGVYNVAADARHWPIAGGLLEMLRERSIAARISGIREPDLAAPELIAAGARHYAPMCSGCHLAPGMESTEIRAGLYPRPPNLSAPGDRGDRQGAARQFWIIKHGLKFTGMPAWGRTHDDQSIWALVAFMHKLPELSPEAYRALTSAQDGHTHGDGADHHDPAEAAAAPAATGEAAGEVGPGAESGPQDHRHDGDTPAGNTGDGTAGAGGHGHVEDGGHEDPVHDHHDHGVEAGSDPHGESAEHTHSH